jgi:hypothetical protein
MGLCNVATETARSPVGLHLLGKVDLALLLPIVSSYQKVLSQYQIEIGNRIAMILSVIESVDWGGWLREAWGIN